MKVFNFESLKRGEKLADIQLPSYGGSTYYDADRNDFVHVRVDGCGYHQSAGHTKQIDGEWADVAIDPVDFGVEAICFCEGEYNAGTEAAHWEWTFLCTKEFFEANKDAILAGEIKRHHNG